MKVKNIMFFGAAAVILSAAGANAVTPNASEKNIVTSKYYVDSLVGNETNGMATQTWVQSQNYLTQHQDISGKQDKDTDATAGNIADFDANGNSKDSGKTFDTANGTITADSTTAIPSSAQVAGYVTTQITESAYNDTEVRNLISTNATNITTNATNITTNANDIDALESGKQDKPASATANNIATFNADKNNIDSGKAFDTADGTITADSTTAIPSSAQVAGYVTTQITESAYNDTEVRNLISTNATNITTNANDIDALESGKQDKPASATANNIATFNADKNNIDSGKAFDTANGTISASSTTAIPSSAQVAGYVQSITNGNTIPAQDPSVCNADYPCALVDENGTLTWKRMAQPGA